MFGTDTHPDLVKMQCEQGAVHSYRDAQDHLDKLNCQRRSANNHVQIQRITNQVGERLSQQNQLPPSPDELYQIRLIAHILHSHFRPPAKAGQSPN